MICTGPLTPSNAPFLRSEGQVVSLPEGRDFRTLRQRLPTGQYHHPCGPMMHFPDPPILSKGLGCVVPRIKLTHGRTAVALALPELS